MAAYARLMFRLCLAAWALRLTAATPISPLVETGHDEPPPSQVMNRLTADPHPPAAAAAAAANAAAANAANAAANAANAANADAADAAAAADDDDPANARNHTRVSPIKRHLSGPLSPEVSLSYLATPSKDAGIHLIDLMPSQVDMMLTGAKGVPAMNPDNHAEITGITCRETALVLALNDTAAAAAAAAAWPDVLTLFVNPEWRCNGHDAIAFYNGTGRVVDAAAKTVTYTITPLTFDQAVTDYEVAVYASRERPDGGRDTKPRHAHDPLSSLLGDPAGHNFAWDFHGSLLKGDLVGGTGGTIDVACRQCALEGQFGYYASIQGTVDDLRRHRDPKIEFRMTNHFQLDMHTRVTATGAGRLPPTTRDLLTVSLGPFRLPGLIDVDPVFSLAISAHAAVGSDFTLEQNTTYVVPTTETLVTGVADEPFEFLQRKIGGGRPAEVFITPLAVVDGRPAYEGMVKSTPQIALTVQLFEAGPVKAVVRASAELDLAASPNVQHCKMPGARTRIMVAAGVTLGAAVHNQAFSDEIATDELDAFCI